MIAGEVVALSGGCHVSARGARRANTIDLAEEIELTIRIRRRSSVPDVFALGRLPPHEKQHLTREEFAAKHGLHPDDENAVLRFAQQHGLKMVETHEGGRNIKVRGTAAAIQAAFRVELGEYESERGRYRGHEGYIYIPSELEGIVTGVFGMDTRRVARPYFLRAHADRSTAAPPVPATSRTSREIVKLYGVPDNVDGAGQCIAVLEFAGGYDPADLAGYFQMLGGKVPEVVSIPATGNMPGDPEYDGEVVLDIEVAAGVAPGARIAVYFTDYTEKGWVDGLTSAIHDAANKPTVLSISWGYAEGEEIWSQQAINAVNELLEDAGVLGVTVCVATGDDGSADEVADGKVHCDFPASSPFALACGGTTLECDGTGITSEVVWNRGPRSSGGGASGGGVSQYFAVPPWQAKAGVPQRADGVQSGRGIPDVAAVADSLTGYTIFYQGGLQTNFGGTSAAAPLWAGLIALLNQALRQQVGYFNPRLYESISGSGGCRDVTSGTNDPTGKLGAYAAKIGWDPCTGWGSPNGVTLMKALQGMSSEQAASQSA